MRGATRRLNAANGGTKVTAKLFLPGLVLFLVLTMVLNCVYAPRYIEAFVKGVYSEDSGDMTNQRMQLDVVTANSSIYTIYMNNTNTSVFGGYGSSLLYFASYLTPTNIREYWVVPSEWSSDLTVEFFNCSNVATYTLQFYDLSGLLITHKYVELHRLVDGVDKILERKPVDNEGKVAFQVEPYRYYTIILTDGLSSFYTYGNLFFGATTLLPLTLKGITFPENVKAANSYVWVYAERYNNYSTIKVSYEDVQNYTANVQLSITDLNGTLGASQSYTGVTAFVYTWLLANYNESYIVHVAIQHSHYGDLAFNFMEYRGGFNVAPWSLPIGTIFGLKSSDLLPMFLLGGAFLVFSKTYAVLSGFFACALAAFMVMWGWVSIPATLILFAFVVVILLGFAYAKRRIWY